MNKYLIVATDDRSYLDLKNIVIELRNRNLPYFFLYSNSNTRISPTTHLQEFSYDTNLEYGEENYLSKTLGFELPFKPNILLITNENWEPEKSILLEFKQWGCFIGCVENSTWLRSGIKGKLEIGSRKRFPSNCIDVYFEHSKKCKEVKELGGMYPHQSIITGNPRNDNIKYKCTNENKIIIYGSMEKEHHYNLLNIYRDTQSTYPEWEIYYKPHPNEILDFPNDFDNIKVISNYEEYFNILPNSTFHVMIFSSMAYYPLILNKNLVIIDNKDSGVDNEDDIESYKGHEFNFWSPILNLKDFEEFKTYIGLEFLEKTSQLNEKLEKDIKVNLEYYKKGIKFNENNYVNNKYVLKYFDEFNDNKASKRIINYLENEE